MLDANNHQGKYVPALRYLIIPLLKQSPQHRYDLT